MQRNPIADSSQEIVDPEYDGLRYNALYVSAGPQDNTDINYSAVDLESSQNVIRHPDIDSNYTTVETNVEISYLKTIHDNKCNIKEEKYRIETNTNPSPHNECSVEYAVVDKRLRRQKNESTRKEGDTNPDQTYSVVDKNRKQDL